MVAAFLAAARDGDFDALLAVLDPDVVLRADYGATPAGMSRVVRGARDVAGQALTFSRVAFFSRPVLVNGAAGVVTAREGEPLAVLGFTVARRKVVEIYILADPERLRRLDLTALDARRPDPFPRLSRIYLDASTIRAAWRNRTPLSITASAPSADPSSG